MEEFDAILKQRKELKEWWALGATEAKYDGRVHELRVNVQVPNIAFCGQSYAGAKDYHEAPQFFLGSVANEMREDASRIISLAYEKELARLNEEIKKYRSQILKMIAEADD